MMTKRLHTLALVGLAVLLVLAVPALVLAQTTSGALGGTVMDETAAALPGATVVATQPSTGFVRNTVSGSRGSYLFPSLPVGSYTLKVSLAGFATVTTENVEVDVATTRTLNVTLKLAKVEESVVVTAEVPLVETSPAVGTVVDQNQLHNLPLNGRQFANLGVLAPGTMLGFNTDPTKPDQLVVQLDGGSGRNVNYVMDGGDNTDDTIGGQLQNFNLESVQEFKIQTMEYKAEYGRSSGGVLTVVSKAGTNDFHGSVWEFARRKGLNSEDTSEHIADNQAAALGQPEPGKSDYKRDQFGASLGGPIVKDAVHFFATYERNKKDLAYIVNPADPVLDATYPDLVGKAVPLPSTDDLVTAKLTYDVDPQNYLQVRYGYQKNDSKYGQGSKSAPSYLGTTTNKYSSVLAGYTAQIGASALNEFVFQYSKFQNGITADSNAPNLYYPNGFNVGQNINTPQHTNQTKYQYKDDFSFSRDIGASHHDFKFGLQYINEPTLGGDFSSGLSGLYAMIPGPVGGPTWVVAEITKYGGFSGDETPTKQYSAYVQDDWKVSAHFTVNMGLRYDYYDALRLDQRSSPIWQMLSTQTTYNDAYLRDFQGGKAGITHNDKNGWGPRIGFSWDINGNGKQVLRGGVGRFFDFPYSNATLLFPAMAVQSNYGVVYDVSDPNGIKNADGSFFQPGQPLPPCPSCSLSSFAPNEVASPTLKPPRSDQASLGYSWQATDWLGFTAEAVRSEYRNLPFRFRANPRDPVTGIRRFPQFGNFRIWYGKGFADYNGLNLGVHMRGEKFELQGFYTLSQATGNIIGGADEFRLTRVEYQPDLHAVRDQSANPFDPTCSKQCVGPLDTDAKHRITLAGSYRLPVGFTVSGMYRFHTGTPYTEWQGLDYGQTRFMLMPGADHVNNKRGASFSQLDLRLSKTFDFAKDMGVELIAEVFNVFNTKNPALYDGNCGYDPAHPELGCQNSDYGKAGAYAGDPFQGEMRLAQLGVRFHF